MEAPSGTVWVKQPPRRRAGFAPGVAPAVFTRTAAASAEGGEVGGASAATEDEKEDEESDVTYLAGYLKGGPPGMALSPVDIRGNPKMQAKKELATDVKVAGDAVIAMCGESASVVSGLHASQSVEARQGGKPPSEVFFEGEGCC